VEALEVEFQDPLFHLPQRGDLPVFRKEEELRAVPVPGVAVGQPRPARVIELLFLEVEEDLPGPVDDGPGDTGQLGDMDAVALVGGAGDDLAQKNDLVLPFPDRDVIVPDPLQVRKQLR
jgi:hypothetical protein